MIIRTAHSSGRWDRSPELLARNIARMREGGRTIVTRTEMGRNDFHNLLLTGDSWRAHHPLTDHGRADCSIEWNTHVWRCERAFTKQLTEIRVFTRLGFQLPPTIAVCALLKHHSTGRELMVATFHRNLKNTARRRAARAAEARTLRAFVRTQQAKHPDRAVVLQFDENSNQRLPWLRGILRATVQQGTRLRNLWVGHLPENGGTHGRSLLDVTLSTLPGRSWLLADDESSDHRPYASEMEWDD